MSAKRISCFLSSPLEIDTGPIVAQIINTKTLLVPRVGSQMEMVPIASLDGLIAGKFGIREPPSDFPSSTDIDLMIMPGLAFDTNCNRLGYGRGYYDKFLAANRNIRTIAIGYHSQLIPNVPVDDYDIRPDCVLIATDNGVLEYKNIKEL
jgi:5-formyltetrahydrofolate cyclo-ligase